VAVLKRPEETTVLVCKYCFLFLTLPFRASNVSNAETHHLPFFGLQQSLNSGWPTFCTFVASVTDKCLRRDFACADNKGYTCDIEGTSMGVEVRTFVPVRNLGHQARFTLNGIEVMFESSQGKPAILKPPLGVFGSVEATIGSEPVNCALEFAGGESKPSSSNLLTHKTVIDQALQNAGVTPYKVERRKRGLDIQQLSVDACNVFVAPSLDAAQWPWLA